MGQAQEIIELVAGLSPESQQQVREFVEALIAKQQRRRASPAFDWAGALADLREKYTSVDLQHPISRWRS
jgi:hypothetical protein